MRALDGCIASRMLSSEPPPLELWGPSRPPVFHPCVTDPRRPSLAIRSPSEMLPTADVRLIARGTRDARELAVDAHHFGWAEAGDSKVLSCFPPQYSRAYETGDERCVPQQSARMVQRRTCQDRVMPEFQPSYRGTSVRRSFPSYLPPEKTMYVPPPETALEKAKRLKAEALTAAARAADDRARDALQEKEQHQREVLRAAADRGVHYSHKPKRRGAFRHP